MSKVDLEIEEERKKRKERRMRYRSNSLLRDRIKTELTQVRLRKMFQKNKDYLQNIFDGKIKSVRHEAFYKSVRTRQAHFYTIISYPFTDEELDWILEEMNSLSMRNKKEQMDNKEYVWKVLVPVCFYKLCMDMFGIEKDEAKSSIGETLLEDRDKVRIGCALEDDTEEDDGE